MDLVRGLMTLGGVLEYPNSLINAMVVSYKWYTALVEDQHGQCDENSEFTEEFHSLDGQVFLGLQSVQIAHAFMDYINKFPIRFRSHDPVAQINDGFVTVPMSAVSAKCAMADLRTVYRFGCMRSGSDILNFPKPDKKRPTVDGK